MGITTGNFLTSLITTSFCFWDILSLFATNINELCRMWHHPKPSIFNVSHFRYSRWKLQNTKLSCITDWSNYCMRYVYLQKDWDVSNIVIKQLFKLTTCRNLFLQVINYGNKMPSPYPHLFTIFRSREKWKLGEVQNMRWSLRLGFGDRRR